MTHDLPARTSGDVLKAARRRDSLTKRSRALKAVQDMLQAGETVTFAAVAKQAGVSSWLVYAPGVREHVDQARQRQALEPVRAEASGLTLSSTSARTDLLLARQEISRLRDEARSLREGMHLQLGHQVDQMDGRDLQKRLTELTSENHRLAADARAAQTENRQLKDRVQALEDDLMAARTSLRRMIRDENRLLPPP